MTFPEYGMSVKCNSQIVNLANQKLLGMTSNTYRMNYF